MVSLHAEVPAHGDILELHDVIDTAEMELKRTLHCDAVIHMDPIITDDAQIVQLRRRVAELVRQVDSGMTIHDFRVVPGPSTQSHFRCGAALRGAYHGGGGRPADQGAGAADGWGRVLRRGDGGESLCVRKSQHHDGAGRALFPSLPHVGQ